MFNIFVAPIKIFEKKLAKQLTCIVLSALFVIATVVALSTKVYASTTDISVEVTAVNTSGGTITISDQALKLAAGANKTYSPKDAVLFQNLRLKVNDYTKNLSEPALNASSRTFLPLRALTAAIGIPDSAVYWDNVNQIAIINHNGIKIEIAIGSDKMIVNGVTKNVMDNDPGRIIKAFVYPRNNRTYMPMRPIVEALGYTCEWDAASNTAHLKEPGFKTPQEKYGKTPNPAFLYNADGSYNQEPVKSLVWGRPKYGPDGYNQYGVDKDGCDRTGKQVVTFGDPNGPTLEDGEVWG